MRCLGKCGHWLLVSCLCWQMLSRTAAADACWSKSDCIIRATLHEKDAADVGSAIEINCRPDGVGEEQRVAIGRSQVLELDGVECYTIQDSYGFEYVPGCDEVTQVRVRRFNSDELQPFQCPLPPSSAGGGGLDLEVIEYIGNDINTISATSLSGKYGQLRELHFRGNNLRHVFQHAFDQLPSVEVLTFEREPHLIIKDALIVEQMNVLALKFDGLKLMTAQLFEHLPSTLKQLTVRNVEVAGHRVTLGDINATDQKQLDMDSVALVNCGLEAFGLGGDRCQVRAINLSGNALVEFHLNNRTRNAVESLDLSGNALTHLPIEWLEGLGELRHLYLSDNRLTAISIKQLIVAAPMLIAIDLRDNQLTAFSDESVAVEFEQMPRVRIDHNPWNCIALQRFAQTYPEKFRFFQYDKFISQINVNGLACNPVETTLNVDGEAATATTTSAPPMPAYAPTAPPPAATNAKMQRVHSIQHNAVTFNELDHHSQRTEALIIVFMLPLGIAILFVILYMWIYCEKIFHLSYYRCVLPPFKRRANTQVNVKSSELRADIVRHIPPGAAAIACGGMNDGYELPLNGGTNCNCKTIGLQKCQKRHHLTYVTLPAERPYLIYEEILDDAAGNTGIPAQSAVAMSQEPGYDHLRFAGQVDASTL